MHLFLLASLLLLVRPFVPSSDALVPSSVLRVAILKALALPMLSASKVPLWRRKLTLKASIWRWLSRVVPDCSFFCPLVAGGAFDFHEVRPRTLHCS